MDTLFCYCLVSAVLFPGEQPADLVVEAGPVGAALGIGGTLAGGLCLLFQLLQGVEHGWTDGLVTVAIGAAQVHVHRVLQGHAIGRYLLAIIQLGEDHLREVGEVCLRLVELVQGFETVHQVRYDVLSHAVGHQLRVNREDLCIAHVAEPDGFVEHLLVDEVECSLLLVEWLGYRGVCH